MNFRDEGFSHLLLVEKQALRIIGSLCWKAQFCLLLSDIRIKREHKFLKLSCQCGIYGSEIMFFYEKKDKPYDAYSELY